MSRLEILAEYLNESHFVDPDNGRESNGRWLKAALDLLQRQNIGLADWQKLILDCLKFGRCKGNNVFILGEKDMGKTFLLRPLEEIYDCMSVPAKGSSNLVGAEKKEVAVFNDMRYGPNGKGDQDFMAWGEMLNLLDGNKVVIQTPKTFHSQNIDWVKKQPIFATGCERIVRVINNRYDQCETEQMDARWNYVRFSHTIPRAERDESLVPCGRCFAHLLLNGDDMPR